MKKFIAILFIISMIIIGIVLVNHNLSLPKKQRSSVLIEQLTAKQKKINLLFLRVLLKSNQSAMVMKGYERLGIKFGKDSALLLRK